VTPLRGGHSRVMTLDFEHCGHFVILKESDPRTLAAFIQTASIRCSKLRLRLP
jgi:hypothetical protein